MAKQYLLTPGPTPVPEIIQKKMAKPIIHHRTTQYTEIFAAANQVLKKVFKTNSDVVTFTSSGTGAMEAGIVNTLSKGDTVIVVRGGKFGERFANICNAYGVKVVALDIPWGTAPDPALIQKTLAQNKAAKAVFISLCETSTATVYDVQKIGAVVGATDAILVVDTISGLLADEFKMDEWKVDVAVGGSQKGLMIPPGLAFIAFSPKAEALMAKSDLPKFYFDFKRYKKSLAASDVPFTPAITLEIGLKQALAMIEAEGVDTFIKRHRQDAEYVRARTKAMGLSMYSKAPSYAVTAVNVPEGKDGSALVKACKAKGVTFAGGQDTLKGKIIRIAHMGGINRQDLEDALNVLEGCLKELK
ncbi:MAG: alanine--glyoxylate aminotransferase family protein [Candidatus Omnitrophica bacterium]|nr:alanine--glyoxylate aminotransferase family protein [Candidatus Omnitrophota bacterium]